MMLEGLIEDLREEIYDNNNRNKISSLEILRNEVQIELETNHGNIYPEDDMELLLAYIMNPDEQIDCLNQNL